MCWYRLQIKWDYKKNCSLSWSLLGDGPTGNYHVKITYFRHLFPEHQRLKLRNIFQPLFYTDLLGDHSFRMHGNKTKKRPESKKNKKARGEICIMGNLRICSLRQHYVCIRKLDPRWRPSRALVSYSWCNGRGWFSEFTKANIPFWVCNV
jgi:hypothetical protein